jgi:hypothetical protein
MTILRNPEEVAQRIGLNANGRSPAPSEPKFRAMLENATTRICNSLSTPLELANRVDFFELGEDLRRNNETFRLGAGFVQRDSVVVTDPRGNPVNSDRYRVNYELGSVTVTRPCRGEWKVAYTSGFAASTDDPAVYQDVPGWVVELLDTVSLGWARIMFADKLPDSVSYNALMNAIYRDIAGRVYSRYDRPRSPAHFPVHSETV